MRQFDQSSPQDDELDLRHYLAVIKRRRSLLLVTTATIVGLAILWTLVQTPKYRATSEVLLGDRRSEQILQPTPGAQRDQARTIVDTEIAVMRSRSVRSAVQKELGFGARVGISGRGTTYVVAISAVDADPKKAAHVANVYAETYVKTRRELQVADLLAASEQVQAQLDGLADETKALDSALQSLDLQIAAAPDPQTAETLRQQRNQLTLNQEPDRSSIATRRTTYLTQLDQLRLSSDLTESGGSQIVSTAVAPGKPFAPTPLRNVLMALILGLLIGAGVAFLRDFLDDSISSREDLERVLPRVDVLAVVPQFTDWKNRKDPKLVSVAASNSPTSEAYRTLRTSMQFVGIDRTVKITQVTSPNPGEGKSTTLANLGVQLGRTGKRVVLVDCDLRRPRLHEFFDLPNDIGFTSVLLGEATVVEALNSVKGEPNLIIVPSGPIPPNPSELLSAKRTQEVLRLLEEQADFVLVDSPPVLPVSDSLVLARIVDATVLVVSAGSTTQREAHRALELLQQIEAPIIGVVFNSVEESARYTSGYDGYGYLYGGEREHNAPRKRPWSRIRSNGSEAPSEAEQVEEPASSRSR